MNRKLFAIVIGVGFAGIAYAADQQPLATVNVATVNGQSSAKRALDCTPPNESSDCAALHAQIRANFSASEISMLFGSATASKEYPTSYAKVDARYKAFLNDYEASNSVAVVVVGNPTAAAKP
jgi:hypothetical protein